MGENILIVDDDRSILTALRMTLDGKYLVNIAENGAEALKRFDEQRPDLLLLDIGLPDMSGMELLEKVKKTYPDVAVIMVTAVDEVRTVVKALKLGAYDYLQKPIDGAEVKVTIRNALENRRLKDQIRRIQQPNQERYNFDLVGRSAQLKNVVEMARKVARSSETPILITGESGTGKSHLAKDIHYHYSELPGPFVTINCTAITHELFESELFGYERGAFTGARSDGRKGRFEEAADGTIFLDEIGSMSISAQSKLLGVLEDRIFYKVGGSKPIQVSARIIAASNMNLETALEEGHFRGDLFFRLNVVRVDIPPLRERPEDIMPLTEYFMAFYNKKFGKKFSRVSPDAKRILSEHPWPGNVRELRNTVERIVLLEDGNVILAEHMSFLGAYSGAAGDARVDFSAGIVDYDEAVKNVLKEALRRSQGNVLEAARLLKVPPHKLRYRIKRYGLSTN
jgi:DNA-binding NtrC family response regulator